MSSLEIEKVKAENAKDKDARQFSLGDTLDVKASVILVVIVFLATQSGDFFHSHLGVWETRLQYLSVAALVAAGVLAFIELCPRNYSTDDSVGEFAKWLDELVAYYRKEGKADQEKVVEQTIEEATRGICQRAKERAEKNLTINKRKSSLLYGCYLCTAISFAVNLLTLIIRVLS